MNRQKGVSLVEVLVTLVISVVGILGILSVQAEMSKSMQESYNKTQALIVMNSIRDMIFANKPSAPCYAVTGYLGTSNTSVPNCAGFGTEATQKLANSNLAQIDAVLKGSNEINEQGEFVGGLLRGRVCIDLIDSPALDTYNITIVWQGVNKLPTTNTSECGGDDYGEEGYKRVYRNSVAIASLRNV